MTDTTTELIENLESKLADLQDEVTELRTVLDRLADALRPNPIDHHQQRLGD